MQCRKVPENEAETQVFNKVKMTILHRSKLISGSTLQNVFTLCPVFPGFVVENLPIYIKNFCGHFVKLVKIFDNNSGFVACARFVHCAVNVSRYH